MWECLEAVDHEDQSQQEPCVLIMLLFVTIWVLYITSICYPQSLVLQSGVLSQLPLHDPAADYISPCGSDWSLTTPSQMGSDQLKSN